MKNLDGNRKGRVKSYIDRLEFFPLVRMDIVKIRGFKNSYRLRIGDIRVWFEYDENLKIIFIRRIGFRGGFYK